VTTTATAKPTLSVVAPCEECGETRMGVARPWRDHRGVHLPHTCYPCHARMDDAEHDAEIERIRRAESEAVITEYDRMWDAREMAGEW